jgi:excisionase family DNA binding protein
MQLLRIPEVARRLDVSVRTVYRLLEERRIPKIMIRGCVRIQEDDLARYIERNTESRTYGTAEYARINYVPGMKVV